jgi:hypothetical protein
MSSPAPGPPPCKGKQMDIESAFTQEAIAAAGVDVGGDEENEVRAMIEKVCVANEVELTRDEQSVAVLCFVAGRAYQHDQAPMVPVFMTPGLISSYLQFLESREE